MPDEDPRDRFSGLGDLKDEYEGASQDGDDGSDEKDSTESNDSNDVTDEKESMTDVASTTSNDGTDSTDSNDGINSTTEKEGADQGVKASRENVQAYIPADEKEQLEETFRKIKALCNLSDRDEPLKNDFYAAAFRHGYQDLEAIATYLGLEDAYDEYGEMVS